jgi:hypothetical protein
LVAHPVNGSITVQPWALGTRSVEQDSEFFNMLNLKLNGSERLSDREAFYFSCIQPSRHHTVVPGGYFARSNIKPKRGIYCYSFALDPQSSQPSGSLNFSRIDTARMELKFSSALNEACEFLVFARSINQSIIGKGVMVSQLYLYIFLLDLFVILLIFTCVLFFLQLLSFASL